MSSIYYPVVLNQAIDFALSNTKSDQLGPIQHDPEKAKNPILTCLFKV